MTTGFDCYEKWGDPHTTFDEGKYMAVLDVPEWAYSRIKALPKRIYCNRQMEVPLLTAFWNIIDRGLENEVETWDGCFQVRPIRGYEKEVKKMLSQGRVERAMVYMSIHSWGIAFDINAATNGLGKKPQMSPELVKCFTDADFDWGGNWKRKDGMHFQLSYLKL